MSTQLALLLVGGAATLLFLMLALVGPRYRPRLGTSEAVAEFSQASEIAADRDRLRAEHAVEVHRLERRMHRLEEVLAEVRIADARGSAPLLVLNAADATDRAGGDATLQAELQSARAEVATERAARAAAERQIADLTRERDRLAAADVARQAGDTTDVDRLTAERDAVLASVAELTRERDAAILERDVSRRERNDLSRARATLMRERDTLAADRDSLRAERDRLLAVGSEAERADAARRASEASLAASLSRVTASEARVRELEKMLAASDPAAMAALRQRVITLETALAAAGEARDTVQGELDIARIERVASATRIEMLERLLAERNAARGQAGEGDAGLRTALETAQRERDSAQAARAAAEEARILADSEVRRLTADLQRVGAAAAEADRLRTEQQEDETLRRRLSDVAADVVRLASILSETGSRSDAEPGEPEIRKQAGKA